MSMSHLTRGCKVDQDGEEIMVRKIKTEREKRPVCTREYFHERELDSGLFDERVNESGD